MKQLIICTLLLALAACGVKGDLVRPSGAPGPVKEKQRDERPYGSF